MKPILKFAAFVLMTINFVFIACEKEEPLTPIITSLPPPPPLPTPPPQSPLPPFPPLHDSLSDREFLYNNLTWQTWGNPYVEIEIPDSHLFLIRGIEVSLSTDSFLPWINVPFYTVEFGLGSPLPFPVNNGYVYDNNNFDSVFLFAIVPNNNQLVGTTVSVKIKVL
jgi:hypothetical protein